MLHLRAGFFQQDANVLHRLLCLCGGVAEADKLAIEREAGLTAQEHEVPGAHGHAHLVGDFLPRIVRAGVEAAETLVSH